jgi:hypothetical protein
MASYVSSTYQEGFEPDQVRIGAQAARDWVWPHAFDLEDLLRLRVQPGFDPATRHHCFLDGEMVGYVFFDRATRRWGRHHRTFGFCACCRITNRALSY